MDTSQILLPGLVTHTTRPRPVKGGGRAGPSAGHGMITVFPFATAPSTLCNFDTSFWFSRQGRRRLRASPDRTRGRRWGYYSDLSDRPARSTEHWVFLFFLHVFDIWADVDIVTFICIADFCLSVIFRAALSGLWSRISFFPPGSSRLV